MFERRLKLFLGFLGAIVVVLLLRAAQLQVVEASQWQREAADTLRKVSYLATNRGSILDRNGNRLAYDHPCTNACVYYSALLSPADPTWLQNYATQRLKSQTGDAWKATPASVRRKRISQEMISIQKEIDAMWSRLAQVSGEPIERIEQARQSILQRVEMRKKYIWYQNYLRAGRMQGAAGAAPSWEKWLSGEGAEVPEIDKFFVTVGEERQAHVILPDISVDVQNELARHPEQYPGLVLLPGLTRYYPYDDVAAHVLGHLGKVDRADLLQDPNRNDPDQRRKYLPNDDIGRDGLERLCEPALRGTMGTSVKSAADDVVDDTVPPQPGSDVRCTIDINVQRDIQNFFAHATLRTRDADGHPIELRDQVLHGAAVLLDVKTDQVLAMVSYPTYDLNHFDDLYPTLRYDDIDAPLRNRATESQLEPGSTMKPLVGLAGITQGVIKVNEGIECKGYLELPDHHGGVIHYGRVGRCWVASMYARELDGHVAHHPIPFNAPHVGHDGNADGWLTYSDGLMRSCNVYFETVADRLGIAALSDWMSRFGLGRPTGVGIEEAKGRLPNRMRSGFTMRERTVGFLAGIGQGYVAATPIQMANVAATIARGGIWMRPSLVMPDPRTGQMPPLLPGAIEGPSRVDLHLDPAALQACRLGMIEVVNYPGGTGTAAHMDEILVAGKTGTAQAAPFRVPKRDPVTHKVLRDANNVPIYQSFELSTPEHPNPQMSWYRGSGNENKQIDHAWMIGFAPANDPVIAFGVLVEYGGSGGGAAADVVRTALESCIENGYLKTATTPTTRPTDAAIRAD